MGKQAVLMATPIATLGLMLEANNWERLAAMHAQNARRLETERAQFETLALDAQTELVQERSKRIAAEEAFDACAADVLRSRDQVRGLEQEVETFGALAQALLDAWDECHEGEVIGGQAEQDLRDRVRELRAHLAERREEATP